MSGDILTAQARCRRRKVVVTVSRVSLEQTKNIFQPYPMVADHEAEQVM